MIKLPGGLAPRPRWHLLYFALAGLAIVTVVASAYFGSRLLRVYTDSVGTNQVWANRSAAFRRIRALAADVNAPGNDVFDSLDVPHEEMKLDSALVHFRFGLEQ